MMQMVLDAEEDTYYVQSLLLGGVHGFDDLWDFRANHQEYHFLRTRKIEVIFYKVTFSIMIWVASK